MNNAKATQSPILHTIGFDISTDPDRGTVVLIDGRPLAIQDQGPYGGFLPAELFSEQLPLMPGPAPHRVAIAPCECGVTECGNITLLVGTGGADEQLVVWTDFRDRGSAVSSPSDIEPDPDPDDRARITHDDLVFDRVQYEAAVLAAGADRTWETPAEATARLLQGMLVTDSAVLRTLGLVPSWVAPSWNRPGWWTVALDIPRPHRTAAQHRADMSLRPREDPLAPSTGVRTRLVTGRLRLRPWEHAPRQVLLELTAAPGPPVVQAADLYRQLDGVPLADWEQAFPKSHPHRG